MGIKMALFSKHAALEEKKNVALQCSSSLPSHGAPCGSCCESSCGLAVHQEASYCSPLLFAHRVLAALAAWSVVAAGSITLLVSGLSTGR